LKLNVIDRETSNLTGISFSIKYHDIVGIGDFLILRQIFERGNEIGGLKIDLDVLLMIFGGLV
jgi:hypothetical protein